MTYLSIGQVARQAGIATSAIRYYEQIGLLPEPEREGGQRRYTDDVLWRLALIQRCRQAGFTLSDIRRVLSDFPDDALPAERWRAVGGEKFPEIERQIAELERVRQRLLHMLECDCGSLAACAAQPVD